MGDLGSAATSIRQGVNLLQIAVKADDATGVTQATAQIDAGSAAMAAATTEIASLQSQYGPACP